MHIAAHTPGLGHSEKSEGDLQQVMEKLWTWVLSHPSKVSQQISDIVYKHAPYQLSEHKVASLSFSNLIVSLMPTLTWDHTGKGVQMPLS